MSLGLSTFTHRVHGSSLRSSLTRLRNSLRFWPQRTRITGVFILLCVGLGLWFLLTTATALGSMYLMRLMSQNQNQSLSALLRLVRDLTNLAASKDIETYRNLTAVSQMTEMTTSAFSEANVVPMDDQSMVKRLAGYYEANGIDPSQAYDNPLDDFGGAGAFM